MNNKNFAVGFDLDGTLWNSLEAVSYSWKEAVKNIPDVPRPPSDEEIAGVMGLPPKGIAAKLFPYLSPERAMEVFDICTELEIKHVRQVGGRLFDGLISTLDYLSAKYPLYIVSNCQLGYIEAFLEFHGLTKYFVDHENAENTGLSKGENIKLVMARNGFADTIYIGDTAGDERAAREAGVPFIFATYGFGQAEQPERSIDNIAELMSIL